MKSTNQPAIKPTFSARPPSGLASSQPRSEEQTIKELAAVDKLTEQPALVAAESIGLTKKILQPWEVEDPKAIVAVTYRLPAPLVAKLKYLAGTTFGETQTSILVGVLGPKLDKMLKEKVKA